MPDLYFVSGQAGSGVHETLCLLRDIYRMNASPSLYSGRSPSLGQGPPEIWRINPTALAALRGFPSEMPRPCRIIYLQRPAYEREKALREAGIPFPIALRHIVCDLCAFRGWEAHADLILRDETPQVSAMHLYDYILRQERRAAEDGHIPGDLC